MAQVENLDTNHSTLGIEVQNDAWLNLLGFGNRLVIDALIDGRQLAIDSDFHVCLRDPVARLNCLTYREKRNSVLVSIASAR